MDGENKIKYGFGLDCDICFGDEFDTIEELIAFAKSAHDDPDGNYWDEDWEKDEYPDEIYIGIMENVSAVDIAPSIEDIADQMTDAFYCRHNIDDDAVVEFHPKKEAEEAWRAFIEKYAEIPCQYTCHWIGVYDLVEDKWTEHYGNIKTPNAQDWRGTQGNCDFEPQPKPEMI